MKAARINPPTNQLGSGVTEKDLQDAVSKSGFPVQTIVANFLRPKFHVQEEWGYIDKDSKEPRTLDILAEHSLHDPTNLRVRPILNLLIECKQSALPYVFFLSEGKPWIPRFPLTAGLREESVTIATDDDPSSWSVPILTSFGLDSHPFIKEVEYCMSFAKCVRKGNDLELVGSEPFHALILPILKAMHHFRVTEAPKKSHVYFDCHLVCGIGVINAPMVGVHVGEQSHDLMLLPWVRVVRHEADVVEDLHTGKSLFAIDIVHKDFFRVYVAEQVLPFAEAFSRLAIKHQEVLASGKAFATGIGKDSFSNIEQRLRPKK